jgi:hypothetical protein
MPIDANIALGVRPVEPVNMLGQMGQMMQLRQAQQGFEEQNALRDAFAQGTDISDPAAFKRIAAINPKLAFDLKSKHLEQQQKGVETGIKINEALGGGLEWLSKNPSLDNAKNLFGDLVNKGVLPPDKAQAMFAKLQAEPDKIGYYANLGYQSAITAQAKMQDATSRANAATATGPAYARLAYDIKNPTQHFFTGEDGTLMGTSTRGGGSAAPVPMAGGAPSAPTPQISIGGGGGGGAAPTGGGSSIMVNPTSVNAFNPTASVNQNALITQAQPTLAPAAPTYAKVRATPVTKDIVDPTDPTGRRMITVEVNTYKAGTGLGVDGTQTAPAGVLGVATSQIPANYLRDPNNPQGVIPVPGSAADPNAVVPPNYRKRPDGKGFEFIPGGPADPAVKALQTTETLSAKDIAARNAKYPVATQAVKSFEANATDLEKDITELLTHKGLNSITGIAAGRMGGVTDEGRAALAIYNRIVAKGGFSELQSLRNASPTGGALGNISNQEGTQLKEAFATIDRKQEAEDVRKGLRDALIRVQGAKERVREGYDMTYSYKNAAPSGFTYVGKE